MVINDLRLTFVITETILDIQTRALSTPLAFFVTPPGYRAIVDGLQDGRAAPLDLRLPWLHPEGHHFWNFYLHEKAARDARGKLCFAKLVPLRLPILQDTLDSGLESSQVTLEGFYYPYGTGLLISLTFKGTFDITKAGAAALRARFDKIYQPSWLGASDQPLSLNQLVTAKLDRLRDEGFGSGFSGRRSQLFSIATVVRGAGVDPHASLVPGDNVHRLLNGMANWVRPWQRLAPPALEAGVTMLDLQSAPRWPGDLLFAGKRGRAVWFPGLFTAAPGSIHSLGCYHRNLAIASLQVESLLMLAAAAETALAQPPLVPAAVQDLGRMAAGLLGRLHAGKNTYRSDSLRSQIGQSDQFQDVNALRQRHDMEALPDGAPAEADAPPAPNGSDKDSAPKKSGQTKPASSEAGPAA